ncbi:hypothetical protein [Aeromonas sobria]|uniref:hypothetical protein n=1 Tax=Aeromonas sobria TaxID=646 RepID=UPI003D0039DA
MANSLICLLLSACSLNCIAADWDWFDQDPGEGEVYLRSYSGILQDPRGDGRADPFDTWLINTGYQYNIMDDVTLFMEGGPAGSGDTRKAGFNLASGLRYQLNPQIHVGSQLSQRELGSATTQLELSSRLQLPYLALTANYGISPLTAEQSLSIGMGFHF